MALAQRIIVKFLVEGGQLVKYKRFTDSRRLAGDPVTTAHIYNDLDIDEMIIVSIDGSDICPILDKMTQEVFCPVTAGGGVYTLEQVRQLLLSGADKVVINSAAADNDKFVRSMADKFGRQCVSLAMDYRDGRIFHHGGREAGRFSPVHWAKLLAPHVGEIVATAIDRDGTGSGYDLETLKMIQDVSSCQVIASGGCGKLSHVRDALKVCYGAAVSSMFFFSDKNPVKLRSWLLSEGCEVRA